MTDAAESQGTRLRHRLEALEWRRQGDSRPCRSGRCTGRHSRDPAPDLAACAGPPYTCAVVDDPTGFAPHERSVPESVGKAGGMEPSEADRSLAAQADQHKATIKMTNQRGRLVMVGFKDGDRRIEEGLGSTSALQRDEAGPVTNIKRRRRITSSVVGPVTGARFLASIVVGFCLSASSCAGRHRNDGARTSSVPSVEICQMRVPVDADGLFCVEPSEQDYLVMPELRNLREVSLVQGSELTAAAVKALEKLPRLEELLLGTDNLDDESLGHLSGLVQLKTLHIPRSNISDVGVETIVELFPDLEELGLCLRQRRIAGCHI